MKKLVMAFVTVGVLASGVMADDMVQKIVAEMNNLLKKGEIDIKSPSLKSGKITNFESRDNVIVVNMDMDITKLPPYSYLREYAYHDHLKNIASKDAEVTKSVSKGEGFLIFACTEAMRGDVRAKGVAFMKDHNISAQVHISYLIDGGKVIEFDTTPIDFSKCPPHFWTMYEHARSH